MIGLYTGFWEEDVAANSTASSVGSCLSFAIETSVATPCFCFLISLDVVVASGCGGFDCFVGSAPVHIADMMRTGHPEKSCIRPWPHISRQASDMPYTCTEGNSGIACQILELTLPAPTRPSSSTPLNKTSTYLSVKAPVLNRFRDMMRSDLFVSFDVRNSAAHFQDAVVGTG
jgi:hypothetical protein